MKSQYRLGVAVGNEILPLADELLATGMSLAKAETVYFSDITAERLSMTS